MLTRSQADSAVGGARALWGAALGTGLVLILVAAPVGSTGWQETARSEGVVVTERFMAGQRVPTFRAIGLVDTDLPTVLRVILDVDRHTEWLQDCTASRMLMQESESVSYIYHRTDVPWPLADRDVILRNQVEVVEPGRLVFVRFRSAPDRAPVVPGVVRITTLEGFYRIEALAPRRTSIEYRVDVEPAGRLPGWIQRRVTRAVPLGTVLGLRRQSILVAGEGTFLFAAESEAVVNPSARAGVVASEAGTPISSDRTENSLVPETAAADIH